MTQKIFAAFFIVLLFTGIEACSQPESKKIEIKTNLDSVAYGIGMQMAENMERDEIKIDIDILRQGYLDVMSTDTTKKPLLTMEDFKTASMGLQTKMQTKMQAKEAEQQQKDMLSAAENKKAGIDFMKENATKEGIQITPSGIQYKVLKMGSGAKPAAQSKVKVHYTGTLINGKTFDSSVDRGEPVDFELNRVIRGWTEGIQLMPVGSKFIFYIPSELAYGDRSAGPDIPAGSTLIFEVELLDIAK
jgi:FKBP-type peptidyl-prolyl cis-trans isomerase FklB